MTTLLLIVIYFIFISLGLPDAMLGSAWPMMYPQFQVPVSYAGAISMIIALGTVISALQSDRLTKKFGPGIVTACSVGITCIALFGFSISSSYWMLCLWAVPYGLGAGSVDASINNYVAIHYESRHMSWLHCMWGVGTTIGPVIMGAALTGGYTWNMGYRVIGMIQIVLTAIIVFSLPLWKRSRHMETEKTSVDNKEAPKPLSIKDVLAITGAKELLSMFFCYCALEQTAMLWGSSYLVLAKRTAPEHAVRFASMFCIGITVGRFVCGFITLKLDDVKMIRLGEAIMVIALLLMLFSGKNESLAILGLIMIGVGCAPIYPCTIHSTPDHFGEDKSQAIIGMQMAFAYTGILSMPALFGVIANAISAALFPAFLLLLLILMILLHERMLKII